MQKRLPLALDVVIFVLLALMASYQLISSSYHELVGVILAGLLLIHFFLHGAWLKSRLRRFALLDTLERARFLLDLGMLLIVVLAGISGVLISRALYLWEVRPVPAWVMTWAHPALGFLLMGCVVVHLVLVLVRRSSK